MAIRVENIHSLSDFQRNTKKYMAKLKKSGEPTVLTVNGEAELVVQSAHAYQRLLESQELIESMISIRTSLEQAKRGEVIDSEELFTQLSKEFELDLK